MKKIITPTNVIDNDIVGMFDDTEFESMFKSAITDEVKQLLQSKTKIGEVKKHLQLLFYYMCKYFEYHNNETITFDDMIDFTKNETFLWKGVEIPFFIEGHNSMFLLMSFNLFMRGTNV